MRIAGGLHRGVELGGVFRIGDRRIEVRPAAEPRLGGGEEAGVHVDGRHVRIGHVRDKADAGGDKPGIVGARPVDASGEFLGEAAAHGRDVDPDLLEHLALHQALRAAPGIGIALLLAVPRGVLKRRVGPRLALDRLEFGADLVAQIFKPDACALGVRCPVRHTSPSVICPHHRRRAAPHKSCQTVAKANLCGQ